MNLKPIEFNNQRILTTEQIAEVYECKPDHIHQNYANHENRFIINKHFYYIEGDDLRNFKRYLDNIGVPLVSKFTHHLYLWTERGANRHCKILDTDKAWEQFETLEETYFRVKEKTKVAPLPASCSISLSGLASYIHEIRKTMEGCHISPFVIAASVKGICDSCGVASFAPIPVPPNYEQLSLFIPSQGATNE